MNTDKPAERLAEIRRIIERIENRCMAVDGPVTPTTQKITEQELRDIYKLTNPPKSR